MKTKLPVFKKEKEPKEVCSIRLTPSVKDRLIVKHGSLQYAIDYMISATLENFEDEYDYDEDKPVTKKKRISYK